MIKLYAFRCRETGEIKMYAQSRALDSIWVWWHNVYEVPAYAINVKLKPKKEVDRGRYRSLPPVEPRAPDDFGRGGPRGAV